MILKSAGLPQDKTSDCSEGVQLSSYDFREVHVVFGELRKEVMPGSLSRAIPHPIEFNWLRDVLYRVTNLEQRRVKMTEEQLRQLYILIRRPIPWDPVPWWIKLNKDQLVKFNDVQVRLNTKIAEIEAQKIKELSEIAGIPMK